MTPHFARPFVIRPFVAAAILLFAGSAALAQTFGTPVAYPGFGLGVEDFATGDLNGDGKMDVVAVRSAVGATGAVVALGNGDGTFASFTSFGTGPRPRSVALVDLNGDGDLDIVTANYNGHGGNTFSVLYGDGTGALGGEVTYNAQIPWAVEIGDFNGDTRPDVALISASPCGGGAAGTCGKVSVFLNNGAGLATPAAFERNFVAPGGYYHSGYADVKVSDLNLDGKLDLALAIGTYDYGNEAQLQIMSGLGTGGFGATQYFRYPVSGFNEFFHTNSIAVADVTGDLAPDIVLGAQRSAPLQPSSVVVLRNNGSGGFPATGRTEHVLWWLNGNGVHIGNLDDDGDLDIMAVGSDYGFEYLLNDGVGNFSAPVRLNAPGQFAAGLLADLNGSGQGSLDVMLARYGTNPVIVFLGGTASVPCAAGTYSATGNQPCTPASPGSFVAAAGATSAALCPAGTYSATAGSASCALAPTGYFVAFAGSTAPSACMPGTYADMVGSAACTPAPVNYFVPNAGASSATACPAGTHSPSAGASSCAPAPVVVFASGTAAVTTWEPIFPASAYSPWQSQCSAAPLVGPNANWVNPHAAFSFPLGSHPWEDDAPFDFAANWINAWSDLASRGPIGADGRQNWTKYSTQVTGEGDFVVQFLADNCSWIYLDDQLIGVQDDNWQTNGSGRYPVTLTGAGPHTLSFIILDGGGAAGGKFRLETRQSFIDGGGDPDDLPTKAASTTTVSFGAGPFTYTGSAFAAAASVSPGGDATIAYSGDCTNAGNTCTATATYDGSATHLGSTATATITIAPALTTTTVSFGAGPFVYRGSAFTATASTSAAGPATIVYAGDCTNAGSSCAATATSNGDANHHGSGAIAQITIARAVATVAATPYDVEYDGQPHTATFTIAGVNGESGATVGTVTQNTTHTNVGTYSDTWSFTGANYVSIGATAITNKIKDTTSPVITSVSTNAPALWPPNHKMVAVTVSALAGDLVGVVSLKIINVTSSEPDNGQGDGDTAGDIVITGPLSVKLRAERSGNGNGRTYTITVEARDAAGNESTKTCTVFVPKSQGK